MATPSPGAVPLGLPQDPAFARQWNAANLDQRLQLLHWFSGMSGTPGKYEIPLYVDYVVKGWVAQNYGAMAAYLNDPEIGPILMQAGREGWTPERLQATIQNTNWWKSTNDSARKFDLLQQTDPASAQQQLDKTRANLTQLIAQEGVADQFTSDQLSKLVHDITRGGVTDNNQIMQMLMAEVNYSPTHAAIGGKFGGTMQQVNTSARDYLVPMSDQQAFQYAKSVDSGQNTIEGVRAVLADQAASLFPWMGDAIKGGQSVRQVIDPYITQTAKLLDKSPDQIDPTDPKFLPIIDHVPAGDTQHRIMTLAEAGQYVRGLPDYQQTPEAHQQVASLGQTILKNFGKIAG